MGVIIARDRRASAAPRLLSAPRRVPSAPRDQQRDAELGYVARRPLTELRPAETGVGRLQVGPRERHGIGNTDNLPDNAAVYSYLTMR